jgi:hypothetical protein
LKISHVDSNVVSDIIEKINKVSGKEASLTITRGKKHEYLGMLLNFGEKGKVKVDMIIYVEGLLANVPSDMCGMANTSAASHLLQINNENPTLLEANKRKMFHTLVAKLLYLAKRGRPDIMFAISFLCTRVKNPNIDDYRKLGQVVKVLAKNAKSGSYP